MKYHHFSLATAAAISLSLFISASVPCIASKRDGAPVQNSTDFSPEVLPGSPVRKAILDALRQEMKHLHSLEMIFVVKYMKARKGWAWVHTLPQSPNGMNRYEDISALLHLKSGTWKVAELACTEEENPKCLSNPEYFKVLKIRFPEVPEEILPGK